MNKLAIDFGATNSVIAGWNDDEDEAEILTLNGISEIRANGRPLAPSLVYVNDGQAKQVTVGQAVREGRFDYQKDNRLFRNFKRGIVASPAPPPRYIDQILWADRDAGRSYLRHIFQALPYQATNIEQLALTTPVTSFENYLVWLNETFEDLAGDKIRIVDESTAAALGYTVTEPEAMVLVFDFGGGTLDLSLVKLPENREKTGGFLNRLLALRGKARQYTAKVIAKAGQVIGGSDIDQWLLTYLRQQTGVTREILGNDYTALLTHCEQAKIALSTQESTEITFEAGGQGTHPKNHPRGIGEAFGRKRLLHCPAAHC